VTLNTPKTMNNLTEKKGDEFRQLVFLQLVAFCVNSRFFLFASLKRAR
jgi:hypothetical protein